MNPLTREELENEIAQIHHDLWESATGKSPRITKHKATKRAMSLFDTYSKDIHQNMSNVSEWINNGGEKPTTNGDLVKGAK